MSGMFMVSGEIWAWTGLTGDSGTFLGSFLSLERAVNVILILVLGNRKQHLRGSGWGGGGVGGWVEKKSHNEKVDI